ncbi:MAG: ABC transporter ATP-binding protein [Geminicoccaceae bacterium]|nr:ABC transporter ATP-binding protein [Geminicoccaceae bacterium]MCX7631437.1 ABC transporter ATP-binding protein [Geminicoccaceae bacterium]MDW8125225.1 ABC transporter ATP-binding protein [Geminicoccaceae bacterium]
MPPEPLLSVRGLRCGYGRIEAVKGVDLEVAEGEIVALVGANGAGKTSLLRAISGVLPLFSGSIRFAGEAIEGLAPFERVARGIVQVPEGRQLFAPLSVLDNLRLGAFRRGRARTDENLERVFALFPRLAERRHLPAGALSGGEQQMCAIGRALMAEPRLLLLDEPSMGLAPFLVDEILATVARLRAQGVTILLVEQNAVAALALADRGYVLETGRIAHSGSGRALLDDPAVRAAYLGI